MDQLVSTLILVVVAIFLGFFGGFLGAEAGRQEAALIACQQQGFTNGEYIDGVISCWDVDKKLLGHDDATNN